MTVVFEPTEPAERPNPGETTDPHITAKLKKADEYYDINSKFFYASPHPLSRKFISPPLHTRATIFTCPPNIFVT